MRRSHFTIKACLALGITASTVLVGCSAETPSTSSVSRAELRSMSEQRYQAASELRYDETLEQLLPNNKFSVPGKSSMRASEALVEGTITSAEPIAGYYADDNDNTIEVPFDSEKALWRSASLTLKLSRATGAVAGDKSVKVGITFASESKPHAVLSGYKNLNRVVAVLDRKTPRLFSGRNIYAIAHAGAMIAPVSENGSVDFLGLPEDEEIPYVGKLTNVDKIFSAAERPSMTTKVNAG